MYVPLLYVASRMLYVEYYMYICIKRQTHTQSNEETIQSARLCPHDHLLARMISRRVLSRYETELRRPRTWPAACSTRLAAHTSRFKFYEVEAQEERTLLAEMGRLFHIHLRRKSSVTCSKCGCGASAVTSGLLLQPSSLFFDTN